MLTECLEGDQTRVIELVSIPSERSERGISRKPNARIPRPKKTCRREAYAEGGGNSQITLDSIRHSLTQTIGCQA
jgi:hypothetical protein